MTQRVSICVEPYFASTSPQPKNFAHSSGLAVISRQDIYIHAVLKKGPLVVLQFYRLKTQALYIRRRNGLS